MVFINNSKRILKEFEAFSQQEEVTYVLYGSYEAMLLFAKSPEILMVSDNFEYHIVKLSLLNRTKDFLEDVVPIESYTVIDETTFNRIHLNLCSKVDKYILEPSRKERKV